MGKLSVLIESEEIRLQQWFEDAYYEDLITGRTKAASGHEKVIQVFCQQDAALALAYVGMQHPAARVIFRKLAEEQLNKRYMLPLFSRQIAVNANLY